MEINSPITIKSLSQSYPKIAGNLLNVNTPVVETFSENQRGITASQTADNLSFDKKLETSLSDTDPEIHQNICTQLPEKTDSNSTRPLCSRLFKTELYELQNIFLAF